MNQEKIPTLAKLGESLKRLAELNQRDIANARLATKDVENRPWVGGK